MISLSPKIGVLLPISKNCGDIKMRISMSSLVKWSCSISSISGMLEEMAPYTNKTKPYFFFSSFL
jgi:hypothetical protein